MATGLCYSAIMKNMEETKKWIEKAEEDMDTAKFNINGEKIEAGLFFLQQAAEKALKAVYIKKFNDLLKTHDLILLSKKLGAPKNIQEHCKKINPAYGYTRYPDVTYEEDLEQNIKSIINNVEEIIIWAKKNL